MGHSRKRKHKSREHSLERLARKVEKIQRKLKRQKTLTSSESSNDESLEFASRHVNEEDISSDKENTTIRIEPRNNREVIKQQSSEPQGTTSINKDLPLAEIEIIPLDENRLKILGEDPTVTKAKTVKFHPDLAARWKVWLSCGLPDDIKKEILGKYARNGNCLLESPELNPEVSATFNDSAKKRDEYFRTEQNLVGTALAALGAAITQLLSDSEEGIDELVLLESLSDAGKILTELHHTLSIARKKYILPSLDKDMRETLQKADTDTLLFGEKLGEKIRNIKACVKIGKELKTQPIKKTLTFKSSRPLNYRGPSTKTRETPRMGSSSKSPLSQRYYNQKEHRKSRTSQKQPSYRTKDHRK